MADKEQIKSGCFLRMRALYDSFKKAERRLADYIFDYPEKVAHCTIKELESMSDVSYATIVRFCKKVGFSGFRAFKSALIHDILNEQTVSDIIAGFHIDQSDSTQNIIKKTFNNSINTLQETQSILNTRNLELAAQKILDAREVYIIGTGISSVSAQYVFTRFFRIGINCSYESDPTIYKLKSGLMQKKDILLTISSSGRSANIVDAARIVLKRGATVISLSDFAISPLTRISAINLYSTPRNTAQFSDLDVQLLSAQINIIDALFFCCCSKMGPKAVALMKITKNIADKEKI
jgi:RpiR family carbohydrate utilization transcriptional regulator